MATPRPPSQRISLDSPAPPPPPKVEGTQYIWADARADASAAPSSARMAAAQLPADVTQAGIVPGTARSVGHSQQPSQQPPTSGRSQAAPLPVVTADNLPAAWNTQKTSQAQLPGPYEAADLPAGMQYPEAPKKPGKRKKGRKGIEDDGGGIIIPPDPPAAGLSSSALSFGGPPSGGISSAGGVIPPPSPRQGGGPAPDWTGWGQGLKPGSIKSGTATPYDASQGNTSVVLPPIEIVPESPHRGVVPHHHDGWPTGRTLSQPLPGGNPWTTKIVPSPLPTASPGRSKATGGFGPGGWGEPATSSPAASGGLSSAGGVVPTSAAPTVNKKKKKREGGGGW